MKNIIMLVLILLLCGCSSNKVDKLACDVSNTDGGIDYSAQTVYEYVGLETKSRKVEEKFIFNDFEVYESYIYLFNTMESITKEIDGVDYVVSSNDDEMTVLISNDFDYTIVNFEKLLEVDPVQVYFINEGIVNINLIKDFMNANEISCND